MSVVYIEGAGFAAAALSALCEMRGDVICSVSTAPAASSRIVMLDPTTCSIIEEIFGCSVTAAVPTRALRRRAVAWTSPNFEVVSAPALLCDITTLAVALMPERKFVASIDASAWVADCRNTSAARTLRYEGGRRAATALIASPDGFDVECAYVASTPNGWIYAAALSEDEVAVTGVFPAGNAGLRESFVESISFLWPAAGRDAHTVSAPRRVPQFAESERERCLLIGDGAIAADPLRGDGVGNALRSSILAHAVIGSRTKQECNEMSEHYRRRLCGVFKAHLRNCVSHYSSAWNHPIWRDEIEAMGAQIAVSPNQEMNFRLQVC